MVRCLLYGQMSVSIVQNAPCGKVRCVITSVYFVSRGRVSQKDYFVVSHVILNLLCLVLSCFSISQLRHLLYITNIDKLEMGEGSELFRCSNIPVPLYIC